MPVFYVRGAPERRGERPAACECPFALDRRLQAVLEAPPEVVVTQGFIARDDRGDTVLLGRGGSETPISVKRWSCGSKLPAATREGDIILIANAGAYGFAMASRYKLREPAAEHGLEVDSGESR